ncbi:MAG: hypothetical protein LQ343_002638 [Gyalolechia ehrenbergii]|nr:MAG: hypothetical protein LQ343_002638 [Gyalolechia ehrenbergii]
MVNYYTVLGLPDTATQQEIEQTYQDLHAENGGNGRKRDNRLISKAYVELKHETCRKKYDSYLDASDKQLRFAAQLRKTSTEAQAVGESVNGTHQAHISSKAACSNQ